MGVDRRWMGVLHRIRAGGGTGSVALRPVDKVHSTVGKAVVAGDVEYRTGAAGHTPERGREDRADIGTGLLKVAVLLLAATG